MAKVTKKKTEKKSKRLEDVPIVRDVPGVFPEDLPGLSPTRQVELQIDLVPDAALIAQSPYKLAPSKRQELSNQLQVLADKGLKRPSSSVRELRYCLSKKGWILQDVHQLLRIEQTNHEESLPLPRIDGLFYQLQAYSIHEAQVEAFEKENVKDENLRGIDKEFKTRLDETFCIRRDVPMAQHGSKHHHLCQQILDMFKDEGRLPETSSLLVQPEIPH
ncbi:hypothetical protein Tco_1128669 [Tanacetum coccineum]